MHYEKTKTITDCYRPATWGRKKLLNSLVDSEKRSIFAKEYIKYKKLWHRQQYLTPRRCTY